MMSLDVNIKKKSDKIVINVKGELFEDVNEPIYVSLHFITSKYQKYTKFLNIQIFLQSKSPKAH